MGNVIKTIEGIVLKATDYQEKSKIIQVFSREHGLMSIYLRGANEYRHKTYSLAQVLTHASFSIYYKEHGLSTGYSGEILNGFMNLKLNFDKNVFIFHLFELILKTIEKHEPFLTLFDLLLEIMLLVDRTDDPLTQHLLTLAFEFKLLYYLGLAPVIDRCVECGQAKHISTFDPSLGGFICRNCLSDHTNIRFYSLDTLQAIIQLYTKSLDVVIEENITPRMIQELRWIIDEYYRFHLGVTTHSRTYLPPIGETKNHLTS